jgi:hypothetical protein
VLAISKLCSHANAAWYEILESRQLCRQSKPRAIGAVGHRRRSNQLLMPISTRSEDSIRKVRYTRSVKLLSSLKRADLAAILHGPLLASLWENDGVQELHERDFYSRMLYTDRGNVATLLQ